ncbi:DUF1360 domain-containing protein [Halobacillus rhizosphaerae]|uniref:DUF1360 domain-containing protein n=1 Tax=Halobacillus rhizosphaerae TaxID=3064889 RepID=UPI00398A561D
MNLSWIELLVLSLASFRFTRLIVDDLIMEWLRKPFMKITSHTNERGEQEEWIEPNGWIGEGLSCHWCVGVWSALLMLSIYIFIPYGYLLNILLAVAGIQSIIYGLSRRYL